MIGELAGPARRRASARAVQLDFDLKTAGHSLRADPVLLQQGVLNLIDNALLHGGPDLTRIAVTTDALDGNIQISVSDNGMGIPPNQMNRATARFGQVSQSEGSGLGLPIAIAVAENIGGTLDLRNLDTGLNVTLTLPIATTIG